MRKQNQNELNKSSNMSVNSNFNSEQVIIFSLAEALYGINSSTVEGILKMQSITVVPRAHSCIEGVTNLRGNVVPVINLHKRLNLPLTEETLESRIINVKINSIAAGLIVDSVHSVLHVDGKNINAPPKSNPTANAAFFRAVAKVDDQLVTLLDLAKVLHIQ
jgi:purine-binding chemotaxis protein CheW